MSYVPFGDFIESYLFLITQEIEYSDDEEEALARSEMKAKKLLRKREKIHKER